MSQYNSNSTWATQRAEFKSSCSLIGWHGSLATGCCKNLEKCCAVAIGLIKVLSRPLPIVYHWLCDSMDVVSSPGLHAQLLLLTCSTTKAERGGLGTRLPWMWTIVELIVYRDCMLSVIMPCTCNLCYAES